MFDSNGAILFTDVQVGALRMLIAGTVLIPFALKAIKKIESYRDLLLLAIVGFCGNFFPAFLFTFAENGLSSGFAGMLNSFTPIFTILIGFFIFKTRLSSLQVLGVLIGTTGIILLMLAGKQISMTGTWMHILAIVLATFFYAISLNTIKHTLQHFKAIEITSLAFLTVWIPSLFISYQANTWSTLQVNPNAMEGLVYISILAIVGTAFAVLIFNQVISYSSALFASSVTYFIPVVAVIIGLNFNEKISLLQIGAMIVVFAGVFIANYLPAIKIKLQNKNIS